MSDPLDDAARAALGAWLPAHAVESLAPLGSGHIHDTFVARCSRARGVERVVLQRINTNVFPDPEALTANLARVSAEVERSLIERGVPDPERRHLRAIATADGEMLYRDPEGRCWRAFPYIENTRVYETLGSAARAREAARAFGEFLADLAALEPDALTETIPGFHDLPGRIAALERAIAEDPVGRAANIGGELDAARRHADTVLARLDPNTLPRRVVHNDCKLDNLLFDTATDVALCVVDLDTVMAGSALYDFGELVRTGASTAAEDERDLSRVRFDIDLFRPLASGFIAGGSGLFVPEEVHAFAYAGPRMTLENVARFLTDHLEGDRYFRVHRPDHNLDRARVQLRLLENMLEAEADTREILDPLAGEAP